MLLQGLDHLKVGKNFTRVNEQCVFIDVSVVLSGCSRHDWICYNNRKQRMINNTISQHHTVTLGSKNLAVYINSSAKAFIIIFGTSTIVCVTDFPENSISVTLH